MTGIDRQTLEVEFSQSLEWGVVVVVQAAQVFYFSAAPAPSRGGGTDGAVR